MKYFFDSCLCFLSVTSHRAKGSRVFVGMFLIVLEVEIEVEIEVDHEHAFEYRYS